MGQALNGPLFHCLYFLLRLKLSSGPGLVYSPLKQQNGFGVGAVDIQKHLLHFQRVDLHLLAVIS